MTDRAHAIPGAATGANPLTHASSNRVSLVEVVEKLRDLAQANIDSGEHSDSSVFVGHVQMANAILDAIPNRVQDPDARAAPSTAATPDGSPRTGPVASSGVAAGNDADATPNRVREALEAEVDRAWKRYRDSGADGSAEYREGFADGVERALLVYDRANGEPDA